MTRSSMRGWRPARALSLLGLLLVSALIAVALAGVDAQPASAQTPSAGYPGVTLDISIISLTERDDSTDVTVTATMRQAAAADTTISLGVADSPLLTQGVNRAAARGADYTTTLAGGNTITIAAGSAEGQTTFAIDPAYDTDAEGDEAIILTGTASGLSVSPIDLIIEDGPYLSFPKYIYGHLSYPGQPIETTVEEAINKTADDSTVTYSLTRTEPAGNPMGLTFDPATRQLTGTAPADADVPHTGLTTRYTITATEPGGRQATTLVSVAVVKDVCSSTRTTWFGAGEEPPPGLTEECNVLLAARDTLNGAAGRLNWATDTLIDNWDGLTEFHTGWKQIRRIEALGMGLNGTIPPVLGHLTTPSSMDLVLGDDYRASPPDRQNKLTGPIPPELGLPPNMIVLALSDNNLTGPIPRELANNGKLRSVYLSYAGLSSHIPTEFGDLPLVTLNIVGNRGVSGHIPWQLGKNAGEGDHPGLRVLNLSENSLIGNIPWQLGRFGSFQQLALSHNHLTGPIPWQLGNLGREEADVQRRVTELFLNGNRLTGSIPWQLGNIVNVRVISLSQNHLTGPIPAELGGLPKLRFLYLRDNRLTGPIPAELGNLGALRELHLYNNGLTGPIPAELGNLGALRQVSLACNDLSGPVPARIGSIALLNLLEIQNNPQLDRTLPASFQRDGLAVTQDGPCHPPYEPAPLPTPTPTPTPTATPTATPTPQPTATSTPQPAATSAPGPGATSAPEPGAMPAPDPAATPEPEPGAASSPEPAAVSSPDPAAPSAPSDGEGLPLWLLGIVLAGAVVILIGLGIFVRGRARS